MKILYKKINGVLHYWDSWFTDDNFAIIYRGQAGQEGKAKRFYSENLSDLKKILNEEKSLAKKNGYKAIPSNKEYFLMIEYKVNGLGTYEDVQKRQRLQDVMQETLGWTGLGHCDGGSIGANTMEVCCIVVDFQLAKQVVENKLLGTEFENFTRIYKEGDF